MAVCPNCGQIDLDDDELSCYEMIGSQYREYRCHVCGAFVSVELRTVRVLTKRVPRMVTVELPPMDE